MDRRRSPKKPDDERVSLAPLDPLDALRALLAVDPDTEPDRDESAAEADVETRDT